jgi:hypothetical protein
MTNSVPNSTYTIKSLTREPLTLAQHFQGEALGREFRLASLPQNAKLGLVMPTSESRAAAGFLYFAVLGNDGSPL